MTKKITKKNENKKNKLLYLLIFVHIHYFLQSAREVRVCVLVKCQNSYVIFLQSSEVKKRKQTKNKKRNQKIMKKMKMKKNKLLYLLIFTYIRPYSLIFVYIRYFLQSAGEVRIGVLVKCWNITSFFCKVLKEVRNK